MDPMGKWIFLDPCSGYPNHGLNQHPRGTMPRVWCSMLRKRIGKAPVRCGTLRLHPWLSNSRPEISHSPVNSAPEIQWSPKIGSPDSNLHKSYPQAALKGLHGTCPHMCSSRFCETDQADEATLQRTHWVLNCDPVDARLHTNNCWKRIINTTGWSCLNPSGKYGPSIRMMIPNIRDNEKWQPNHQPE